MRDGNHPQYMDSGGWLKESLESCCGQYFPWVYQECMMRGGLLDPAKKYFADFQTGMCMQVCAEENFGCKRVPPLTDLYESIEECCEIALSWVDINYCYSRSIDSYSDGWVVDFPALKCCTFPLF